MENQGTPKNLREAITQGLCCGPLSEIEDRMYWVIRDFLAQRFGAKMLDSTMDHAESLDKLYKLIILDEKFSAESPLKDLLE